MSEQTSVEGTQVERLQQSLEWFVAERDYFEGVSNQHYDKWQEAEKKIEVLQQQNKQMKEAFATIHGIASETFESHNQLELIRLTAAEHIQGASDDAK